MWFEQLTGFREQSPEYVRSNLYVDGDTLISKANNGRFVFGELEIATLQELRNKSSAPDSFDEKLEVCEVVGDVQELHCQKKNSNALFQAASQFNLLEMIGPQTTPEQGIDRYEFDRTQGPACAIACGAGTIYRNYFIEIEDQVGQSTNIQIDCLDLIGEVLQNDQLNLWTMKNGYALATLDGLLTINKKIALLNYEERESLKGKLKTGIQWNTEVTKSKNRHKVSQHYCSALPVSYCQIEAMYWESFSRIILEAAYESTLYAGLINLERTKSNLVYLTLVGGGAFGNEEYWILESLQQALVKFRKAPLDVRIVSYGESNENLINCINDVK